MGCFKCKFMVLMFKMLSGPTYVLLNELGKVEILNCVQVNIYTQNWYSYKY